MNRIALSLSAIITERLFFGGLFWIGGFLLPVAVFGQYASCSPESRPFRSGEKTRYEIRYDWGMLWVRAGTVTFSVRDTVVNGRKCYHFVGKGRTYKKYDRFYKVRDRYEAIASRDQFRPYRFKRDVQEGKNVYYEDNVFDHGHGEIYTLSSQNASMDTTNLSGCVLDVLSAIYYCRSLDFEHYQAGDTIPLTLFLDEEVHDTYVVFRGETEYTAPDGTVYSCYRFMPKLIKGSIFSEKDEMEVLVTQGPGRIPVFVRSGILIGSIRATLISSSGSKVPTE